MRFISIFGGAKPTQPDAANNSWVVYRSSGTVFVFVHGVQSSAKECWFNPKSGTFWPNLVRDDDAFAQASIFLGGYHTQIDAGEYGMRLRPRIAGRARAWNLRKPGRARP
jgi:hypothetical protein